MIEERRRNLRFPVMQNVGEPINLQVLQDHKKVSIPGFIMDLSSGGVKIMAMDHLAAELKPDMSFVLDLKLPHIFSHHVEGKIVRIQKADKHKVNRSNEEWYLSLKFTKIRGSDLQKLNRMGEDWSICETKIELGLPDICYKECSYWDLCEKGAKLKEHKNGK